MTNKGIIDSSIQEMFNRIAHRYDSLNHVLTFGLDILWRKNIVKTLPKNGYLRVLDICTGTGDQAYSIYKYNPSIKVIGHDFAMDMLKIGKKKFKNFPLYFVKSSVSHLCHPCKSFDASFCSFGLRNIINFKDVLKELNRVLKPEGKLIVLDFFKPTTSFGMFFYLKVGSLYIPLIGRLLAKDYRAYRYLVTSVNSFVSVDDFINELKNYGFETMNVKKFFFGIAYGIVAVKKS